MLGESAIITALLLILILALVRSKRRNWAAATLPLMLVPAVNCLIKPICDMINTDFTFEISVWVLLIAVMVSCVWVGFLTATLLNRRKTRAFYMIGCVLFNFILAGAFVFDYYKSFGLLG
ncbi:MAG: hypothetical protein NC203_11340 [Firmicutes bacterium]|nr:hypothetical protein [[Eubacterium] siraeum]MCM1488948.1 hypothetical protein [Bacillota bacterium]